MMKALKTLIGAAQRNDATADELAVSVRDAGTELQAARAALAQAQEAYQGGLLNADDQYLRRLSDARTEAQIRLDRAEAIAATLAERNAAAIEREAQAVKLQQYEAAKRRASEMRDVLLEMYPAAAQAVVDIIRALAETEIEVAAANKDLPAGMSAIPGVEVSLRAIQGSLPHVVSETEEERWCFPGDDDPEAVGQEYVEVSEDGRGLLRHSRGGVEYLIRRKFIRREHSAFMAAEMPDRFAIAINLPGIGAKDPAYFSPLRREGVIDPEAVLKHLDRPVIVSAPSSAPKGRVEWKPADPIDAEAERRECATVLDRIRGHV